MNLQQPFPDQVRRPARGGTGRQNAEAGNGLDLHGRLFP